MEAKLNPEWDGTSEYVPRSERKEWSPIGLLGKLYTRKDQVIGSNWIKLSDINDNIARYLVRQYAITKEEKYSFLKNFETNFKISSNLSEI